MRRLIGMALAICMCTANAMADPAQFSVTDASGEPLANAVIMVAASDGTPPPVAFDWPNAMSQQDRQFTPYVLIVPKGSEVEFPNRDRFRHHVYSFSKGNRFELKLYGREESRYVTFDKAGIVAVGCNIHDDMIGFIRVVDTPYAVKTGADGTATLDLPAGTQKVSAWHPTMRGDEETRSIDASTGQPHAFQLDVPSQTGHAKGHH